MKKIIIAAAIACILSASCCRNDGVTSSDIIDITDTAPAYTLPKSERDDSASIMWHRKVTLFLAICEVESGLDTAAVSIDGRYVGPAQIGEAMRIEANRIIGEERFTHDSLFTYCGSLGVFLTIMDRSNPEYDIDDACRIWNPRAGRWYTERVLNVYNDEL